MKITTLVTFGLAFLIRPSHSWTGSVAGRAGLVQVASTMSHPSVRGHPTLRRMAAKDDEDTVDLEWLKAELTEYLKKREESNADAAAKENVGKKIGGTKGNAILEFVSVSPNKESTVEAPANPFDYDELTKYGYSNLVTPMMKAGGRFAMYELLDMEAPQITSKPKPKSAPKLVIDRTGESDRARYSGLKLGQILDDSAQAEALQQAQAKLEKGEELRPKLEEEFFEAPFADRRNVGPAQTPSWTPEKLDEWGRNQGKAQAWARKARDGEFVKDPMETLDLELSQRAYSILTGLLATIVFGKSTPTFLSNLQLGELQSATETLQAPAAALLLAAMGSAVFSAIQAKELNRNQVVWSIKGLLGGPLTVRQLRGLSSLATQAEQRQKEASKNG